MSSKKGYSLEQCDDTNGGEPLGVKCGSSTAVADTLQPEEYCKTVSPSRKTKVSNEEFVTAWLASDGFYELVHLLGGTISAVQARATRLRKAGVNLPSFTRAARKTKEIDVTGLNNMIEKKQLKNEN